LPSDRTVGTILLYDSASDRTVGTILLYDFASDRTVGAILLDDSASDRTVGGILLKQGGAFCPEISRLRNTADFGQKDTLKAPFLPRSGVSVERRHLKCPAGAKEYSPGLERSDCPEYKAKMKFSPEGAGEGRKCSNVIGQGIDLQFSSTLSNSSSAPSGLGSPCNRLPRVVASLQPWALFPMPLQGRTQIISKAGTARCAVRAAFSGATRAFRSISWLQKFRPLDAAGDIAARCPCPPASCSFAGNPFPGHTRNKNKNQTTTD
jgi:hypothetical protein